MTTMINAESFAGLDRRILPRRKSPYPSTRSRFSLSPGGKSVRYTSHASQLEVRQDPAAAY